MVGSDGRCARLNSSRSPSNRMHRPKNYVAYIQPDHAQCHRDHIERIHTCVSRVMLWHACVDVLTTAPRRVRQGGLDICYTRLQTTRNVPVCWVAWLRKSSVVI